MPSFIHERVAHDHIADLRHRAERARLAHSIREPRRRRPVRESLGKGLVAAGLRLLDSPR